jgi:glycosyltransferase involved in cell wall biosynthesis
VTVLTTVYNSAPYLEEAIRSILQQTFADFEFIIIDDGSMDESPRILARLAEEDARVRLVTNEKNLGVSESSNKGIALVRTPLIARQDSDDIAENNRLELQVAFMESHPEVSVLGSSLTVIDEQGDILEERWNMPISHAPIVWGLLFWTTIAHPAAVFRKNVIDAGGYSTAAEHRGTHDLKLWIDLAERGVRFANLPESLVRYRIRAGQLSDVFGNEMNQNAKQLRLSYAQFLLGNKFSNREVEYFLTAPKNADETISLAQLLKGFLVGRACAYGLEKKRIVQPNELSEVKRAWRRAIGAIAKRQLVGQAKVGRWQRPNGD